MEQPRDRYLSACCTLSLSLSVYVSIYPSLSLSLAQVSFCDNDEPLWPNPACNTQLAPFSSFLITFRHEWELQLFNLSLVKREGAFSIIVLIVEKGGGCLFYFIFSVETSNILLGKVWAECYLQPSWISSALLTFERPIFEQYSFLSTIRIDTFVYQFELNTFSCIIRLQSSAASKLRLEGNAGSRLKEENFCFDDFKGE